MEMGWTCNLPEYEELEEVQTTLEELVVEAKLFCEEVLDGKPKDGQRTEDTGHGMEEEEGEREMGNAGFLPKHCRGRQDTSHRGGSHPKDGYTIRGLISCHFASIEAPKASSGDQICLGLADWDTAPFLALGYGDSFIVCSSFGRKVVQIPDFSHDLLSSVLPPLLSTMVVASSTRSP